MLLIPFLLWGEAWEAAFTARGAARWLEDIGPWGWAAGLALLIGDLVLPLPGTIIMSALGYVYGPIVGGLIASAGSISAGLLGYGVCRALGRNVAERLLGPRELARSERRFQTIGPWLIVLSRWLPLLAEVLACLAGLTRMPPRLFITALGCGCLPLGFTFAIIGAAGTQRPALAMGLSIVAPPLLWLIARQLIRSRPRS